MAFRNQALLAVVAAVVFFSNLGGAHLWDVDEAIFSQAAKEMLTRGDYVTPYFNGAVFPDKPAMMYWLMMIAYELFGTTEFAARFFSAAFGVGSVLLTFQLGRLMFSPGAGFWSALALATSLNFVVIARAATPDSLLVFFSTLAVLVFVWGTAKARLASSEPNERNAAWAGQTTFEPSWATWALVYAAMGLGVLTKGPVGVVLPTAVIGLFLLVVRARGRAGQEESRGQGGPPAEPGANWRSRALNGLRWMACVLAPLHVLRTIWSMRPLTALAMILLVAGPWYAWVGVRTDGQWLAGFFGVHNFGRFLNAMENHRGPIFYYLIAIAVGFFPWCVFFGPGLLHVKRQMAESHHPWRPGYILLGSWVVVWVGFFSLAGTKLPSYIVPAYPALALFTGCVVDSWLREASVISRLWTRAVWSTLALVGVGLLIALPIVADKFLHGDWMLGLVGLLPLAAAVAGVIFCRQGRQRAAVWTIGTLGIVLAVVTFGIGAAYVDRYQTSPPVAEVIAAATPPGERPAIGSYRYFRPSFVFYTNQPVAQFGSPDDVGAFFDEHPQAAFLITTDAVVDKLASSLPTDVVVLDTRPRFLQPGNLVVLGRRVGAPATATKPPAEKTSH